RLFGNGTPNRKGSPARGAEAGSLSWMAIGSIMSVIANSFCSDPRAQNPRLFDETVYRDFAVFRSHT
ncbi:MAG: hypothetical protein SWN10_23355, partial [Pseudomonadota bacterium]|nr:hypothetical protein [Pseudomonadota bacterium]